MRIPRWWLPLAVLVGAIACDVLEPDEPGALVPATVAEDPSLPAIEINGSRFHAQTFGDPADPVIVFVHGGPGGDHRSLLKLAERFDGRSLVDDYFLVFWDQRGAGLSMRHDRDVLTREVYLEDFAALVDRYASGRQVYLIGESWGGMYATMYIDAYPERVAGAVLIEPGPLDGETMERIEEDMFDLDFGKEWLNDYAWSSQFLTPDDHARMDYERMLGSRDGQPKFGLDRNNPSPVWRMGAAANRYVAEDGQDGNGGYTYDFTTHLADYTTPVLFIAGSWSQVLGESLQREQIRRYPSASLEVLDGAGHDVAWVKPAEVLTHVRAYLDARQGGAS